jgi:cytochrome c-type biogenesis protein CcmH/NrfF
MTLGEIMRNRLLAILLALLIFSIFTSACSSSSSSTTPASTTQLDGATLLQERCSVCHPLARVESSNHTAAEWRTIVNTMISRGAQLTAEEEIVVVKYLAANFGK